MMNVDGSELYPEFGALAALYAANLVRCYHESWEQNKKILDLGNLFFEEDRRRNLREQRRATDVDEASSLLIRCYSLFF